MLQDIRIAAREPSLPQHIVEGEGNVLEPFFVEHVRDADLHAMAHSEDDLEFLRSVGVRSCMTLALSSRERRIGALTLVNAWSGRRHTREHVRFARVLADLPRSNSAVLERRRFAARWPSSSRRSLPARKRPRPSKSSSVPPASARRRRSRRLRRRRAPEKRRASGSWRPMDSAWAPSSSSDSTPTSSDRRSS